MRVSSISPFDPFAATAVKPTAKESDGKGAEEQATPDPQPAVHPVRPSDAPADTGEGSTDSDTVGNLIDVRV